MKPIKAANPARHLVLRTILVWFSNGLALFLISTILPGFSVTDFWAALGAAAAIGLINAVVWPLVIRFALPVAVLTLGLGVLILNGAIVLAIAQLDRGFYVKGLFEGIVVAIATTLVTTLVSAALAIDDDEMWTRNVLRRRARRAGDAKPSDIPGLLFLEIDGLAHDVLRRAISDGNAPTIAGWLRQGSHQLVGWETGWSSQTGACQAGLLHGDDYDYPAFRWWEKDRGKPIVTNHPRDAAELERRHSNGRGLLHADGASRANILSGDAPHSLLTMSKVLDRGRGPIGHDYFAFFASPYNVARTMLLGLADMAQERYFARQQFRRDVRPRITRSRSYALMRAWGTVIQRDLQVETVIGDIYAGRPVVYTTFLAYDEVAHHSGIERADALATLRRVDRQIARIEAATAHAPRPYQLVVLSDHGQTQGATFLDRYGKSLEEVVKAACDTDDLAAKTEASDTAAGFLNASVTEATQADTAAGRTLKRAASGRTFDGAVDVDDDDGEGDYRDDGAPADGDLPEISVMASGNLGLISFPRHPGRGTKEWLDSRYPDLIQTLREHPGVGFMMVRSERQGALVIGREGVHELETGRVEGRDPLAPFGPNAAAHVKRTDGFPHCPDVMINSTYWPQTGEVAAFEELVGSHGGMGGTQSHPFAVMPAGWYLPDQPIVGAPAMHHVMRKWLADLGQHAYADAGG